MSWERQAKQFHIGNLQGSNLGHRWLDLPSEMNMSQSSTVPPQDRAIDIVVIQIYPVKDGRSGGHFDSLPTE